LIHLPGPPGKPAKRLGEVLLMEYRRGELGDQGSRQLYALIEEVVNLMPTLSLANGAQVELCRDEELLQMIVEQSGQSLTLPVFYGDQLPAKLAKLRRLPIQEPVRFFDSLESPLALRHVYDSASQTYEPVFVAGRSTLDPHRRLRPVSAGQHEIAHLFGKRFRDTTGTARIPNAPSVPLPERMTATDFANLLGRVFCGRWERRRPACTGARGVPPRLRR